jgi:hypothetical protein
MDPLHRIEDTSYIHNAQQTEQTKIPPVGLSSECSISADQLGGRWRAKGRDTQHTLQCGRPSEDVVG